MTQSLESIWRKAEGLGRAEFLVTAKHRYRYADIVSSMRMLARFFDDRGVRPGDRVLICTKDDYAVSAAFLAAVFHGLVPINLSPDVKVDRATAILKEATPKVVLADKEICADWNASRDTVYVDPARKAGLFRRKDAARWPFDCPPPKPGNLNLPADPNELAYLLFTSGSTSSPSGVMISRGNLLANIASVGDVLQFAQGDRQFVDLPMAHTDGLIHGPVLAFCRQATVVRAGGFSQENLEPWLNAVRKERCTHFMAVPYIWKMICKFAAHDDYFDGDELKMLISSAGRLTPELWNEIEQRFGKPLVNEYGMTETVMAALHAGAFADMGASGTLGKSSHCETKIRPTDPAKPHVGELLLRGPNICLGYWNEAARTSQSFNGDGWFGTGDIVARKEDGSYELVGRSKSMINSAGLTISPDEIDEALMLHPSVNAALTVGLPDPDFGEIAVAGVELEQPIATVELLEFLRNKLEVRKVPKRIFALTKMPRGASGKPEIKSVKALVEQRLTEEQATATAPTGGDVPSRILAIAARTFATPVDQLSLRSGPDEIPGWDSFSHINFILALEEEFAQRLPTRKVMGVKTLEDLVAFFGASA